MLATNMPSWRESFETKGRLRLRGTTMKKTLIQFTLLIAAVVGASFVSARLWGGKPEGGGEIQPLVLEETMTVGQFAQRNGLPGPLVKRVFSLSSPADKQQLVN